MPNGHRRAMRWLGLLLFCLAPCFVPRVPRVACRASGLRLGFDIKTNGTQRLGRDLQRLLKLVFIVYA